MAQILLQVGYPDDASPKFTSTGLEPDRLGNLSSLNVFIGPNNSGKSHCLRGLFATQNAPMIPNSGLWSDLYEAMQQLRLESPTRFDDTNDISDFLRQFFSMPLYTGQTADYIRKIREIFYPNTGNRASTCVQQIDAMLATRNSDRATKANIVAGSAKRLADMLQTQPDNSSVKFNSCNNSKHYIPSLRSLRRIGGYENDNEEYLSQATKSDYFDRYKHVQSQASHDQNSKAIFYTGERYFRLVRRYLLGSHDEREVIRRFEKFIGDQFFQGQQVTLVPHEVQNHLVLRVGNEHERPLHNLGDGLQQIIIMTLPMFLHAETPSLVFIEEPELYLHPGMQRKFIETVLSGYGHENRQTFITTHSTQFLDMTLDHNNISVYRFQKSVDDQGSATFSVTNSSHEDRQLLLELGVHNSSVLLANCTLWVEGITDRLYLRRYFDLYQRHREEAEDDFVFFREDTHYSFVEYSGSNLTHWSVGSDDNEAIEMSYLCGNALVICDKDASEAKRKARKALEDRIGDNACILDVREIENLISVEVLSAIVREYENDCDLNLQHFTQSAYKNAAIGKFIQDDVLPNEHTSARRNTTGQPYADQSGTIKGKLDFCRKALAYTANYDQLSDYSKALCERLYKFIASHQP